MVIRFFVVRSKISFLSYCLFLLFFVILARNFNLCAIANAGYSWSSPMTVMVSWLCSVGLGCFCGFDEVDVGVWLGQVACAALGRVL